ncbi:hypothetical protein [Bartonella sp. WD12.1]|uniref:hypothetical protein n=1 Tax=Bartonella sp. WD12.1 TaxID=1933903 RepID=UPI0009C98966|nr:hypothetical protein [Bartonella sp. WD12.1]OPB29808.1 hypothetical protein BWD121_008390 [Bartonella sp. WD12.1]
MSIEKKYKLTEESKEAYGHTLYRIRALRDFGHVKTGDLGGFIKKEDNLSHDGDCWIYDNAIVYQNAKVYGNALVCDDAQIGGKARVYGNARVFHDAHVYGKAQVYGNACVYGNADVSGDAEVAGNAHIAGDQKIRSGKHFGDNTEVDASASTPRNIQQSLGG